MKPALWLIVLVFGSGMAFRGSSSASGLEPLIKERPSIREGSRPSLIGPAAFFYFRNSGRGHRGGSFSYGK